MCDVVGLHSNRITVTLITLILIFPACTSNSSPSRIETTPLLATSLPEQLSTDRPSPTTADPTEMPTSQLATTVPIPTSPPPTRVPNPTSPPPTRVPSPTSPPPTPVPIPTSPQPPQGNCHPSYPDVCIPIGSADYDCAGGSGNGPNYIRGPLRVRHDVPDPDPHGLDRDKDGTACEG